MAERLQKYLARAGIASRRKAEELIEAGRVMVNGEVVTELGAKVGPQDVVSFDGRPVEPEPLEYHLLNKPPGVVSAVSDPRRLAVTQLVESVVRLFPVGRLDQDTTGLLLLTNDGALAHALMHPRYEVDKVYLARVEGKVADSELEPLRRGMQLEDGPAAPAQASIVRSSRSGSVVEVTIHQGRKRQVRRMLAAIGHQVRELHRKKYAMLTDAGLAPGESRRLSDKEVQALREISKAGRR